MCQGFLPLVDLGGIFYYIEYKKPQEAVTGESGGQGHPGLPSKDQEKAKSPKQQRNQ